MQDDVIRLMPARRGHGGWRARAATALAVLVWPFPAVAHEKWFYDATAHPARWADAFGFPGLAAALAAIALTVVGWLVWRARGGRDLIPGPDVLGAADAGRARFYALVPMILGIHAGLSLIVTGIQGQLFSPNNVLPGAWRYWLGVAELGIGVSLLYGGLTRAAAALLALVWLIGIGVVGLEPMLENAHYLGFAAFFFFTGRGPYAIDRLLFPAMEPAARLTRLAMPALRVATGASLAVVAFTEKLANLPLALAFLQQYPLNFTAWLHLPMSDALFVLCAGLTELVIGLWLVFGIFPRTVIATAWIFINMTLMVFVWVELAGHLPLYGVMGILLVWTPDPEDQQLWERGVLGHGADRTA